MAKMNDDLFEDVPYTEANAPKPAAAPTMDDSLFDVNPHPEMQERSLASVVEAEKQAEMNERPDVSASRAALVGAGQGATFGFGEEITAPFIAAAGMASGLPSMPEESTWEKYQRLMQTYRDVARQEQKGAQEQQPVAYTGGAVAGGFLAPGLGAIKAAKTVKDSGLLAKTVVGGATGVGMGGLSGLGEAEGSLKERLPEAVETAKVGGVIGAAIPVVGGALSTAGRVAGKISDIPVVEDIAKSFKRGAQGQSLVTKAGRKEAADVVRKKSGKLYDDIKSLQENVGTQIQDEIAAAKEAGSKVDLTEEVTDVLAKLQKIKAEGSKEAAAYAAGVESEIKKLLKIKSTEQDFMGVAKEALPEGLVVPKPSAQSFEVDPDVAQDLKQVLDRYTPKKGMAPQEIEPAGVARELRGATSEKLSSLTERLPELNEQYGIIKDTLKRLSVNEKRLPEQIKEKINSVVTRLEKQNVSGDNAREMVNDVLENLRKVGPEDLTGIGGQTERRGAAIADKYQNEFNDIVERLNLAEKIVKGGESFSLTGTPKAFAMGAANVAGLAANKTRLTKLAAPVAATTNFAKAVLSNPAADKAALKYKTQGASALEGVRKATEPYKLHRQVASAAENADPELLKDQAEQIRQKHGKQGEQLAQILDNMSGQSKDARRALMFSVLQNQAYRKMLGLIPEEE